MDTLFSRIAIGTANWGKPYGLSGVKVSEQEQKDILDYCICSGIDLIDTATAYEWDWTKIPSCFKVVLKVTGYDEVSLRPPDIILAHGRDAYRIIRDKVDGISLYEPRELDVLRPNTKCIQLPYSLFDRRFEKLLPRLKRKRCEIHVRSVFLQGRILEKATPQECISFCLMNPYVDRVIIGADSLEQLKGNLDFLHRMNSLEVKDENILDPRKW